MKNLPALLIGAISLMATGLTYAIYRKDKEIEKNCNCNKANISQSGGGTVASGARVVTVATNSGAISGGTGGGRTTGEMRSVRPAGVGIATQSGVVSNAIFKRNIFAGDNRRAEFYSNLSLIDSVRSSPIVAPRGTRGIVNGTRQAQASGI